MGGHKKRKQDSDNEDDVEHSASDSDVQAKKATKSKQLAGTKEKQSSSKTKTAKKPKIDESDDESPHEEQPTIRVPTNTEGEKYVELGKMKRATVRAFKGHLYVDIREFYTASPGVEKPGKKGISLTMEQWEVLKGNLSTIDSLFAEQKGKK